MPCQPAGVDGIEQEFRPCSVRGVEELQKITVAATPARHGTGELANEMGLVTGFVFDAGESVDVAGDTLWDGAIAATLATHEPYLAILNTDEAQFLDGSPITMTSAGVGAVAEATDADVVAVHMEVINHCILLQEGLQAHLGDAGIENVTVPTDGAAVGR